MATEYLGDLKRAREQLVTRRRSVVQALGESGSKNFDSNVERVVKIQAAIEAVDKASDDELELASKEGGPTDEQPRNVRFTYKPPDDE